MAQALAHRLARETLHAVYTSDLKRAVQTARPTADQKRLDINQDIRLREGRSINQECSDTYPTLPFYKEVETETDLCLRMHEALSDIARRHDNQTILVVSHGGAIQFFIHAVLEKTQNPLSTYQGIRMALNQIQYTAKKWHCISLNETNFQNKYSLRYSGKYQSPKEDTD